MPINAPGGFQWSDGRPAEYFNWEDGQPSDGDCTECLNCVEYYSVTGKWNDILCDITNKHFICKAYKGSITQLLLPIMKEFTILITENNGKSIVVMFLEMC